MVVDGENAFELCGMVVRDNEIEKTTLYFTNGMIFHECEDVEDLENKDEIVQWGDG